MRTKMRIIKKNIIFVLSLQYVM